MATYHRQNAMPSWTTTLLSLLLSFLLTTAAFAQSADLDLFAQAQPDELSATLAIVNRGPDVARNVAIRIDVPEGLSLVSLLGPETPCDLEARPVRCTLGDLPVFTPGVIGGTFYVSVEFRPPVLTDATYVATFTASSDTPDGNPASNVRTATWVTRIEADMDVLVQRETDRTDPGETAAFRVFVCNDLRNNVPVSRVRMELTATNGTIESIDPPAGVSCSFEEAAGVCTANGIPEFCFGGFVVSTRAGNGRDGAPVTLAVRASSDLPERAPANDVSEASVPVYRWIAVENTNDRGAGSLRDAIEIANAGCSPGPCRIAFEIPPPVPAEGWFTITPSEPLPSLTADRVTLEGSRQTALTGDTNPNGPEVAIDGRLAHRGIKMLAPCEGVVEGLAIGNFDEDQGVWLASNGRPFERCGSRPDRRMVSGNHIGVDPSGTVPWPNLRGVRVDDAYGQVWRNVISHNRRSGIWFWRGLVFFTENRIEWNGASGILVGPQVETASITNNVLSHNREMGVAAARGALRVDMRENAMAANGGLGIDWGLDGVSPVDGDDGDGKPSNAPVLLSATYDAAADLTRVTLVVHSTPIGPYFSGGSMDFYANDSAGGDGERWIGNVLHPDTSKTIVAVLRGDHRGKWINATWTRLRWDQFARAPSPDATAATLFGTEAMTSELSNAVFVSSP